MFWKQLRNYLWKLTSKEILIFQSSSSAWPLISKILPVALIPKLTYSLIMVIFKKQLTNVAQYLNMFIKLPDTAFFCITF